MTKRTGFAWLARCCALLAVAASLMAVGCGTVEPSPTATPGKTGTVAPSPTKGPGATVAPTPTSGTGSTTTVPYMLTNQRLLQGVSAKGLDLNDVDAVFKYIFMQLPDQVIVYPSENYYYWVIYVDGRQIWGNIRLPAGRRDAGVVSFAYFEFDEFQSFQGDDVTQSKYYTKGDGVEVEKVDDFTYIVKYLNKAVTFNLHRLSQEPPKKFKLAKGEVFIMRTLDESGYPFFLLFNTTKNYFLWVLNEEENVPDQFMTYQDNLVVGKRSGFAFYVDSANGNRKILAAIRRMSINRNDYFDGPFDQLADNYVDQTNVSYYMQLAYPGLKGRIDKYGYYTDTDRPSRVAISTYGSYYSKSDLVVYINQGVASDDVYQYYSLGGRVSQPTSTPESTPAPTSTAKP